MNTEWLVTQKPDFFKALLMLSPKEVHQVMDKVKMLTQDPTPDAKVKKQLKYMHGKLHRLRSGNFRIFYTFEQPYISILALRRRDDDTYDEDMDIEFLGGLDPQLITTHAEKATQPDWEHILVPKRPEKRPLPEPITNELLAKFRIPTHFASRLLALTTHDDLMDCPGVPEEYLILLDDYMFERPLVQVLQQPDYILNDVQDLLRYKEGELLGFLLKLSPEQEKYVQWGLHATGPTLLKGGPGTGKSTIALYRVRAFVREMRKSGETEFRILFTTYTNALVKSSEQLLKQLLGDDAQYVEVQTADKLILKILHQVGISPNFVEAGEFNYLLRQAIQKAEFKGGIQQQLTQKQVVERLSLDYLHQEINQVITARQLHTLEDYQATARPGRKVRLNALQRQAVWEVYIKLEQLLRQHGKKTWRQARNTAEECIAKGLVRLSYNAVVIDEAQDLDPSTLRLLMSLCQKPQQAFITADANQSIYGSGFSWNDVHKRLSFQGRTSILHVNYRSTREIGTAAQSYLGEGQLEDEPTEHVYSNNGPLPGVRAVQTDDEEVELLAHFLPAAARELRLRTNACAILCPTASVGKDIATKLLQHGIEATFMTGSELNLTRPGVKVLTLKSAKGLEFPVVALAGFVGSIWNTPNTKFNSIEERDELLSIDRRMLFVGMTRAMRILLVIKPVETRSPLLADFAESQWNIGIQ